MTVKELKEKLDEYPDDLEVVDCKQNPVNTVYKTELMYLTDPPKSAGEFVFIDCSIEDEDD